MIVLRSVALTALLVGTPVQDETPATETTTEPSTKSVDAESLRSRIHDMRMNLLLGGDQVRKAEREAIDFYGNKAELVDQRLDTIRGDLTEKRAAYDIVLDRALNSSDAQERTKAMREATTLRAEITSLESEASDLSGKRNGLGKLIANVESRDKERERLVAQIETTEDFSGGFGIPMTSIGLAPPTQPAEAASPLQDDALVADLLERDPVAARRLLFDADPSGYWQRFPLRPPTAELREALKFPLPDLPGER